MAVDARLGALAVSAYAGGEARADEKRFYLAGELDRLAWVSAEMATSENGLIDWNALSENIRTSYEELRKWQRTQIGGIPCK